MNPDAPVAQLDRALPSEGKGHTFESCRVRQLHQRLGYFLNSPRSHADDATAASCKEFAPLRDDNNLDVLIAYQNDIPDGFSR